MNIPKIEELTSNPNGFCASHFKKHYPEWVEYIKIKFPASKLIESVYLYFYGTPSLCPICGKPTKFISFFRGYQKYCCIRCQQKDPLRSQKAKQTCLERYGDPNYNNPTKNRATKQARYGNPFYLNHDKAKQTCLERYGVENPFATQDVKDKIKQTCLERYGVENPSHSPEIVAKIITGKHDNTLEKHDYLIGYTDDGRWICRCPHPECTKCVKKQYTTRNQIQLDRIREGYETCTTLNPIGDQSSSLETTIKLWLDEWGIKYEKNRDILNGQEIDIYIPALKIGIECNGCYWHSVKFKTSKYHLKKWQTCQNAGVELITIWHDWLQHHPEIVKSMLRTKLGLCTQTIGARKCYIKEITSKQSTKFLRTNHIQGRCNASIHLGLFDGVELIAVMCFARRSKLSGPKITNTGEWELIRFCNKLDTRVIGAAGKLLQHFIKQYKPKIITSFSCNDISSGKLYEVLGFERLKTNVSYWYIHKGTLRRFHRSSFTRAAISKIFGLDLKDKSWTESLIMTAPDSKYHKIYDSGTTGWVYKIKKEEQ